MIIGISGSANCGKDTVANYIVKNYSFVKIAFADKIKRILMDLYDLPYNNLWGPSANRSIHDVRYKLSDSDEYLTARLGCQVIGDCGRSLYLNTWVDYTINDIKKLANSYFYDYEDYKGVFTKYSTFGKKNVIISDCRYLNEMNRLRNEGALLIRIKKDTAGLKDKTAKHSSEANQVQILDSYFDDIIYNNSTLEDLYKNIDNFMAKNI